jgi:hypothetical protein
MRTITLTWRAPARAQTNTTTVLEGIRAFTDCPLLQYSLGTSSEKAK